MKTALLAGHTPARSQSWREELLATGEWDVLGPVQSFASARVLMHRHDPHLLISDLRLIDGTVLDMIRVLRVGVSPLRAQVLVVAHGEDRLLLDALQEGADSFYDAQDLRSEPLHSHARDTLDGGADITPWIASRLLDHFEADRRSVAVSPLDEMISPLALGHEDLLLLRRLAIGRRVADIARYESVSPRAISARVRAIYRKMQWDLRAGSLSLQAA
ncbi:response regulator transcription factor [Aquincola sp. S2]|uniref:Response regulator transcription factor n=1 Tax=Pseudaquabacterium terrae TaxID=2732868 RepID=A0ABX2EUL2_9BURK|nr:response regulator transcription factor [Aquabacterium terrae]NRF72321.1 response regulator transcription factor [Aquabacterium terrae]